jgi:hypothetical protein
MNLKRSKSLRDILPLLLLFSMLPASQMHAGGLERQDVVFKVFQFPPNMIPRIDGNADDWNMVPDSYAIGMDQLEDDELPGQPPIARDPKDLDVKVKVGWVKGLNRLYFLYQAYDNYWDFSRPDLHNDIFEVVVDGDASGGPLIDIYHRDVWTQQAVGDMSQLDPRITSSDAYFATQGAHAQNYHIFTPSEGKDWAMDWGCAQYTKDLPYASHAQSYNFRPGQSGNYTLEFYITPFDYAGCEGPERAVESVLTENKIIGLGWAVLDYDDVNSNKHTFWTLSHKHTFFGNASQLVAFRLMPLEPQFRKPIDAHFSFKVTDVDERIVAFKDESDGATAWKWDFGDGSNSTEQNPVHQYANKPGKEGIYTVILNVTGPAGTSRFARVWDVHVKGKP